MVLALTLSQHIKMWVRFVNVVNMQQCSFGFNEHYVLGFPLGRIYQLDNIRSEKTGFLRIQLLISSVSQSGTNPTRTELTGSNDYPPLNAHC